jgi:hypothetical protein
VERVTDDIRPPIPARFPASQIRAGLAMPYVNVRLADGGVDLRSQHTARVEECFRLGRCQVCGQDIDGREGAAFVGGPSSIRDLVFAEPPMHRECMVYATKACPVLAGRWARFPKGPRLAERARGRACYEPNCGCGGWVPDPSDAGPQHAGEPNHPWWVVFASTWSLGITPDGALHGAVLDPREVSGARLVSDPERGRVWERVDDLRALREQLLKEVPA